MKTRPEMRERVRRQLYRLFLQVNREILLILQPNGDATNESRSTLTILGDYTKAPNGIWGNKAALRRWLWSLLLLYKTVSRIVTDAGFALVTGTFRSISIMLKS